MTPRSPRRQHHKSTTISQRLRNRADQQLSTQPPEIPRLRSVRPRRAPTLPESHDEPLDSHRQNSHQNFKEWDLEDRAIASHISGISNSVEVGAHRQPVDILAQSLETSPHAALRGAVPDLVPTGSPIRPQYQQLQNSASVFPPTPFTSVPDSFDFEAPLAPTNPRQTHNSYIDLQDMR
jgi:hypothetical protein